MKLSLVFWVAMVLCTIASSLWLVTDGQWLAGMAAYTIGFTVAVTLSNWRHNVESVSSDETDAR